jgi:hypothetical protein
VGLIEVGEQAFEDVREEGDLLVGEEVEEVAAEAAREVAWALRATVTPAGSARR